MTTPSAAPGRDVSAQEKHAGVADEVAPDPSGDARGLSDAAGDGGLLSPALRATTIGALALVSLHAFEALALTTVMPTIARDLHGESLYAMAFTATLAAGIVSIVWSGNLADRRGPRPPLVLGLILFALGLVGAGLAPTMPVLVAARVVQGLGAGMTSTALYVLVTRIYPPRLHTAILAGFSAAWVVPSIAGPFVAGVIAQTIGWRWVFGLAIVVLVGAALLLARIVRGLGQEVVAVPWRWRALAASTVLAVAVLVLNLVAERLDDLPVGVTVLLATAALAVVVAGAAAAAPPSHPARGEGPADRRAAARARLRRLHRGRGLPAAAAHRPRRLLTERRRRGSHPDGCLVVRRFVDPGRVGHPVRDRAHCGRLARADDRDPGWPSLPPSPWLLPPGSSSGCSRCSASGSEPSTRASRRRPSAAPRTTEQGFVSSAPADRRLGGCGDRPRAVGHRLRRRGVGRAGRVCRRAGCHGRARPRRLARLHTACAEREPHALTDDALGW